MIRKLWKNIADLFLRGHGYINRHFVDKNRVPPRILNYKPQPDLPKIFHFNANFVIGGTSQLIADIVEKTSCNYTHHVIVPDCPWPLPYQPLAISAFPLSRMPALYKYLDQEKPVLVHIQYWVRPMHNYYPFDLWYSAVFRMCNELKLKVVQNVNVPTVPFKSEAVVHNVFVSKFVRENFNKQQEINSSVIYPGSDLSHFSCPDNFEFPDNSIGMVYRLDRDKLEENTIEIFIAAVKKKQDLICYIIGEGYYLEHYKKRVIEERVKENFVFTGFISYDLLPSYYKKIGLIVAPVHDESFGQVTPFAMSMGLPVVGYDTGALSEILGSKEMLVKYADKESLVNLIVGTVGNKVLKRKLGVSNKERAQAYFSVEGMVTSYENLYANCVK